MKIFCTGSNGMMGWGIKKAFIDDDLILTTHEDFDVTKDEIIDKPDIIFHLAAETDHHRAELNPEQTYYVNHTGTMRMVEYARGFDIPIVYIGTCGMYDGNQNSYKEIDAPSPLNHYGKSKYYGEQSVKSWSKHFIVRCGWGMGGGPSTDKKFVNLIFKKVISGNNVWAINDVFGSPTYTYDFAKTLKNILKWGRYGTFHVAPPDMASRYDVAVEIVQLLNSHVMVYPVSYEEYHKQFPLKVPYTKREVLDTRKILFYALSEMRPWREALKEYIEECYVSTGEGA